jgi:hypothetical protein
MFHNLLDFLDRFGTCPDAVIRSRLSGALQAAAPQASLAWLRGKPHLEDSSKYMLYTTRTGDLAAHASAARLPVCIPALLQLVQASLRSIPANVF